jgi:hypothetical protein
MKIDPIHAGQVALASSLALSVHHMRRDAWGNEVRGHKGQTSPRSLRRRLSRAAQILTSRLHLAD